MDDVIRSRKKAEQPIEPIDSDDGWGWTRPSVDSYRPNWLLIVLVGVVIVGGVVTLRLTSSPVERPEKTHLAFTMGPDLAILPGGTGSSLLYLNTGGNPTLVDLGTGNQTEIRLAPDTPQLLFQVEGGRVVSDDPGDGISHIEASERAFSMLVYRTAFPPATTTGETSQVGLEMIPICGDFGCSIMGDGPILGRDGGVLRAFSARADTDIASLFDSSVWPRDGNWLVAPAEAGFELRVPAPADHSPIYLIDQP